MKKDPPNKILEELFENYEFSRSCCEETPTYINRKTGQIVMDAEALTGEPCPVENVEDHPDYMHIPNEFDLGLEHSSVLVWRFVRQEIPGLEPKVREMFSRKGAFRRWKNFLAEIDLLDKWHNFEDDSVREALMEWCEANGVTLE